MSVPQAAPGEGASDDLGIEGRAQIMTYQSPPRIRVDSDGAARRRTARWRGIAVDVAQYTGTRPFRYDYRAPHHLLMAVDRAVRVAGDTEIDGIPRSTQRDLSGKLTFVPCRPQLSRLVRAGRASAHHLRLSRSGDAHRRPGPRLRPRRLAPRLFFDNAVLWSTVAKLTALVEHPTADSRVYAEALGAVLAIELMRLDQGTRAVATPARGGLAGWQKRLVREAIETRPSRDHSLAELAALVDLSPTHFARAFKRSFGQSPGRYQLQRRIEHAKALLADPGEAA